MWKSVVFSLLLVMSTSKILSEPLQNVGGSITTCDACHGPDGNSTVNSIPKLAAQKSAYLVKQLLDYQHKEKGGRNNPVMVGFAVPLSLAEIEKLARFYSEQKTTIGAVKKEYLARGEALYQGGDRNLGIPACMACHGPSGGGLDLAKFPALSGQYPEYTVQQLKAFREGIRSNDPEGMMRLIASKLSDADRQAVASYIYGLH